MRSEDVYEEGADEERRFGEQPQPDELRRADARMHEAGEDQQAGDMQQPDEMRRAGEMPQTGAMPGHAAMPQAGRMPGERSGAMPGGAGMAETGGMPGAGEERRTGEMPQGGRLPRAGDMPEAGGMPGEMPGGAGMHEAGEMPIAGDERGTGVLPRAGGMPGDGMPGDGESPAAGVLQPGGEQRELFGAEEVSRFRVEWREIQARFVDDPQAAVRGADQLVSEVMDSLTQTFNQHKHELEKQWQDGDHAETEDLRQALRRYRTFFDQLLHT